MTILWIIDRFGLPGHYHRVWVKLLRDNYVPLNEVKVLSLHKLMGRQLLTKHGTRKAPTWLPDEGPAITRTIDMLIEKMKPRAVVLTAPESLACLGLAPEHATLHSLRGSVYWRSGVPHLVMLPMSAWFSLVSQKEIGAANYGFESQEALAAARSTDGQVHQQGDSGSAGAIAGGRIHEAREDGGSAGVSDSRASTFDKLRIPRSASPAGQAIALVLANQDRRTDRNHDPDAAGGSGNGGTTDSEGIPLRQLPGSDGRSAGDGQADSYELAASAELSADPERGASQPGEAGSELDSTSGLDDDPDSLRDDVDGSDDELSVDSEDDAESVPDADKLTKVVESSNDDGEMDQFFYEPILSPVGRFVLTADTQKLFRILRDGKNAGGPSRPIEVNWR